MRELAASENAEVACEHSGSSSRYTCSLCFDAELRKVVSLRFASNDERLQHQCDRAAEDARYRSWAAARAERHRVEAEERRKVEEERLGQTYASTRGPSFCFGHSAI